MKRRIKQIIPGYGWKAVYTYLEQGEIKIERQEIPCFVLITEEKEDGEVWDYVEACDAGNFLLPDVADNTNFLGYEGPTEKKDWLEIAKKNLKKG